MSAMNSAPIAWSEEHLIKLAWIEKRAIQYLDEFIDRQISRGDEAVALKRFPGHVSHAEEYNLRDYIGRSEGPIFDFISDRPYLWSFNCDGYVIKVQSAVREIIHELAILLDRTRKKKGKGIKVDHLVDLMVSGDGTYGYVMSILGQYPELFKPTTDVDITFECLVTVIDGVILPQSITSKIGSGSVKALAVTPTPTSQIQPVPKKDSASGGYGPRSGRSGKSNSASGTTSKSAEDKPDPDTLTGVGSVIHVTDVYGFLFYHRKSGGNIRVYFNARALGESAPLSNHVKIGDRMRFEAVMNQTGPQAGKWDARSVWPTVAAIPKSIASASDDGWPVDEQYQPLPFVPTAKVAERTVVYSDDCNLKDEVEKLTKSARRARSRRRRDRSIRRWVKHQLSSDSSYEYSCDQESISLRSDESVHGHVGTPRDRSKEPKDVAKAIGSGPAAHSVDRVDIGVQTDVTDEEILLRLLRSFPNLLDGFDIVCRRK